MLCRASMKRLNVTNDFQVKFHIQNECSPGLCQQKCGCQQFLGGKLFRQDLEFEEPNQVLHNVTTVSVTPIGAKLPNHTLQFVPWSERYGKNGEEGNRFRSGFRDKRGFNIIMTLCCSSPFTTFNWLLSTGILSHVDGVVFVIFFMKGGNMCAMYRVQFENENDRYATGTFTSK